MKKDMTIYKEIYKKYMQIKKQNSMQEYVVSGALQFGAADKKSVNKN